MFKASSGVSLPKMAYNDKIVTFTLSTANNFKEKINLIHPFENCIYLKALASQAVPLKLEGVTVSNYDFIVNGGVFPFEKSSIIRPQISDPIFYLIDNSNSISYISLEVQDQTQLTGNSLSVTLYFLDYIPSLIAE